MISLLLAAAAFTSSPMPTQTYDFRYALDAIRIVETGGEPNEGIGSRGDGGNARGPYQIHRIYHVDAAGEDKSLGDYSLTLTSKSYSERVVRAYMSRYASGALRRLELGLGSLKDVETVARIHNGGPQGHRKQATLGYWGKVRRALAS